MFITDDQGLIGTDIMFVTSKNVAPTVQTPTNKVILVQDQVSININYNDPGILDTHTATINWKDGTILPATINPITKKISATHFYTYAGIYVVEITVTDNGGATTLVTFIVDVSNGDRNNLIFLPMINR
ncbi:MAG: hypothetical protein HC806_02090 [Anaerolineae bacterium]|nr:hypothetical protein [Anaerolineae bacterium]